MIMNPRKALIKAFYPVLKFINKVVKKDMEIKNMNTKAPVSFYDLKMQQNNGNALDFKDLKNKKVLIVNTASQCGFTPQYDGLQELYESNKENLVILGFPSNEFGAQEKGDDKEIAEFCKVNFGVTFPLMKKSNVKKAEGQNPVFEWLTDQQKNGWNDKAPDWNFCKYLVNENGDLTHLFETGLDPKDEKIVTAVTS